MLTVPGIAGIPDTRLRLVLGQIVDAINLGITSTGIGPPGSIGAPPNIANLTVSSDGNGHFDVVISDDPTRLLPGIQYFVETAAEPGFVRPTVYPLGPARSSRLALGGTTLYFRAYSQYLASPVSKPLTYGHPAIAVAGGGPASPPPPSGAGSGSSGSGGSGYGGAQGGGRSAAQK